MTPNITLAEIRLKNGKMTQVEFAKSLGVTPQTIISWEKDILKIKGKYLLKIGKLYGVKSSDLLGI